MIDFEAIDTVFLDMDGTLLDLHFDNHFWLEEVPRRYAEARGLALDEARAELRGRYRDIEGTLEWYCLDYWSRELGFDILLLKREVEHLIAVHPHVVDFLEALGARGLRRVMVTNAHQRGLALKLERTQLAGHFEHIISAHDLGLAKEMPGFWERLQEIEPFDPARTLFVDDNPRVLRAARAYGFEWLVIILKPDSRAPLRPCDEFSAVPGFGELLAALRASAPRAQL